MDDESRDSVDPENPDDDQRLQATRILLASVEELRALLAPLTPDQREQVLALARSLKERPDSAEAEGQ